MSIYIEKTQDKYKAIATPPHSKKDNWESKKPMTTDQLIEKLLELGCHQTDIGDAFYAADPSWLDNE